MKGAVFTRKGSTLSQTEERLIKPQPPKECRLDNALKEKGIWLEVWPSWPSTKLGMLAVRYSMRERKLL